MSIKRNLKLIRYIILVFRITLCTRIQRYISLQLVTNYLV